MQGTGSQKRQALLTESPLLVDRQPLARTPVTPSDQSFPTGSSPRSQSHRRGTGPTFNVRPPGVVPALVSSGAALSPRLGCWCLSFPPQRTERRSCRTLRKDRRGVTWLWGWIRAHHPLREWHEWSQGQHHQSGGLEAQPRGLGQVRTGTEGKGALSSLDGWPRDSLSASQKPLAFRRMDNPSWPKLHRSAGTDLPLSRPRVTSWLSPSTAPSPSPTCHKKGAPSLSSRGQFRRADTLPRRGP